MASQLTARATRVYGAHPAQLPLVLAGLALAAYALWLVGLGGLWNRETWWQSIGLWLVGAAVAHDLLLFPAYAAADRLISTATRRTRPRLVPLVNFVRVPLMACALITLLFLPGIVRQGADSYQRATGQTQDPFLFRWAALCAVILLAAAAAYLLAVLRARRRRAAGPVPTPPTPEPAPPTRRVEPPPGRRWTTPVLIGAGAVLLVLTVWRRTRR